MDKIKNIKRNFLIFILLIAITFYVLLKDKNLSVILGLIGNMKKEYIFIAIICMIIFTFCEAMNIGRTLKVLKSNRSFFRSLKYALVGFFFSSITPGASGGQPMQIYYMHKDNISISHATLAVLIELLSSQIATIILSLVGITMNYDFLKNNLDVLIYMVYLGVALNLIISTFLIIFIFSKRLSLFIVKIFIKFLRFIRIKNVDEIQEKFTKEIRKYHKSAKYIKRNKLVMLKTFSTALVQSIAIYSIPFWIYCSLGFGQYGILEFIMLQAVLYTTVSALPLPGAVGVSESVFLVIYGVIFTNDSLNSAMLINRGISFYLPVIVSGIILFITQFTRKHAKLEETKN